MATPSIAIIPSIFKPGVLGSVLPLNGDADLTFTRASSATRVNKDGLIETVATGVPRLDYSDGGCPALLLEPQQTQLYELTETMVTQTKTVTAVQHTVGFYGTGTLNFTGAFVGSLVGTGINNRVQLTFTATAGSLISTVSGTVTKSQLVTGAYLGSYIPNITTGQITRLADAASKTGLEGYINSSEGVFYAEIAISNDNLNKRISLNFGAFQESIFIDIGASNSVRARLFAGGTDRVNILTSFTVSEDYFKIAFKYKSGFNSVYINVASAGTSSSTFSLQPLNALQSSLAGSQPFSGNLKDLRVYTTALTDAELTTLTTL
jgi:hypothetical protein